MTRASGNTAPRCTLVTPGLTLIASRARTTKIGTPPISHASGARLPSRIHVRLSDNCEYFSVDWGVPRTQRSRSARAIANDQAIRDAGVGEILRVGIDHVSLRDVGHAAGLTHGATYARYEDVDELLVDLWNSVLSAHVVNMFELCLQAAEEPNSDNLGLVFDLIRDSTTADVAAVQVLLTARRFPTLQEEVEPFIQDYLERGSGIWSDASATYTRATMLFAMMVVQIFADAQFGPDPKYRTVLEKLLLVTLETDPEDVTDVPRGNFDDRITLATGDDLRAQLAYATFGVVGKSGYTRATISRIARRAGCSPGAIYKLFASKEELVASAFDDLARARWTSVTNFINILEVGSLTQLLENSASRENALRQSFNLETALASVHSEPLRTAILRQMRDLESVIPLLVNVTDDEKDLLRYVIRSIMFATIGVTFLATVSPSVEQLDFNQFTEPLRRAILIHGLPTWSEMCRQIIELVNRRGY